MTPPTVVSLVLRGNLNLLTSKTLDGLRRQVPTLHGSLLCWLNDAPSTIDVEYVTRVLSQGVPGLSLEVTCRPDNVGYSAAHNHHARRAHQLYGDAGFDFLVLNPDVDLAQNAVALLANVARQESAVVGPILELAQLVGGELVGEGRIDSLGIYWTAAARHHDRGQGSPMEMVDDLAPSAYRVDGVSGACILLHARTLSAIGVELFDETFIAYREDAELGLRLLSLGIPQLVVPSARGLHARRLRGTERGNDRLIDALGVRNRFLIAWKHGFTKRPGFSIAALLRDIAVIGAVVLRERHSIWGLMEAFRIRRYARAKGRTSSERDAAW